MTTTITKVNYKGAFIAVTSLFFLFGFITVFVDSLIPRLREVFELTYFQSGLVQFAFFAAYGLISIPSGNLLPKIGYKKGLMLGLFTMGFGCFLLWPAAAYREYIFFLGGLFILAGGMTILQVAANPYISVLGADNRSSSRLILAQAFNSLGTTIAPIFGAMLILSDQIKSSETIQQLSEADKMAYYTAEADAVKEPFLIITAFIMIMVVVLRFIKLPQVIDTDFKGSYSVVLKDKRLMLGALGIFVYVGVEVAVGSYLVNYMLDMNLAETIKSNIVMSGIASIFLDDLNTISPKGVVGAFLTFYWGGAMLGRFFGAYLTTLFKPSNILSVFGGLAILMVVVSITSSGLVAMWSILAVGFFNSIMFPTIFTLAIAKLGNYKAQGSGILCTAIVGGAFIPPFYGFLADVFGFKWALLLPIACYIYIFYYGRYTSKH